MNAFSKNNLLHAASPYLRQHAENPVWWQEFTPAVLEHARNTGKPLFISSGYSTCHWCHVMASEAFSDQTTADFLAQHFISIKLDREMHPDVDSFLMAYIQNLTGQGGWPLNVFLTPDLKPFYALTYAPHLPKGRMPSFIDILKQLVAWFNERGHTAEPFSVRLPSEASSQNHRQGDAVMPYLDFEKGGTTGAPKFPPHALLFNVLHQSKPGDELTAWLRTTFDTMATCGLHDHVQGGFFRYCVDDGWEIPHFEKMLYDQSMMLINYSLAYRVLKDEKYQQTARSVVDCLNQTFAIGDAFASAHDADTLHHEGLTYLWTENELTAALSADNLKAFYERYRLLPFEGSNHLWRTKYLPPIDAERQLLLWRNKRAQPFRDDKIITSWNAWAAIALVYAWRYGDLPTLAEANNLFKNLMTNHFINNRVIHCVAGGKPQQEAYLEDAAALFFLATLLYEERLTDEATVEQLHQATLCFRKHGRWYMSVGGPLGAIPSDYHDHPLPAAASTANGALVRWDILTGSTLRSLPAFHPLMAGVGNYFASLAESGGVVLKGPEKIAWNRLPVGALQGRNSEFIICESNTCRRFDPGEANQPIGPDSSAAGS